MPYLVSGLPAAERNTGASRGGDSPASCWRRRAVSSQRGHVRHLPPLPCRRARGPRSRSTCSPPPEACPASAETSTSAGRPARTRRTPVERTATDETRRTGRRAFDPGRPTPRLMDQECPSRPRLSSEASPAAIGARGVRDRAPKVSIGARWSARPSAAERYYPCYVVSRSCEKLYGSTQSTWCALWEKLASSRPLGGTRAPRRRS